VVADPSVGVSAPEAAGLGGSALLAEPATSATRLARFRVDGMTCSSCSSAVESALAALPGVRHASVSITLAEAKVEYEADVVDEVQAAGWERGVRGWCPSLLHCSSFVSRQAVALLSVQCIRRMIQRNSGLATAGRT
jgi:copper chaperone CopZ